VRTTTTTSIGWRTRYRRTFGVTDSITTNSTRKAIQMPQSRTFPIVCHGSRTFVASRMIDGITSSATPSIGGRKRRSHRSWFSAVRGPSQPIATER